MEIPNENFEEKLKPLPSKLGMRHLQAALLFLCTGLTFGMRANMSVAIVAMTDRTSSNPDFETFNWSSQQNSLILSSLLWGCLITQVPIGYFTRKNGAQKFLCFGTILAGVASILIPLGAQNAGWVAVLFCRVVMGMCQGAVTPCVYKLMASWVPPSERARLCSFIVNGAQLGTVALLPTSAILVKSSLGWPSIFYIFGMICIVWGILYYFLGADSPSDHTRMCQKERDYINSSLGNLNDDMETKGKKFSYKQILKSVPVWALLAANCGQGWCYYIFLTETPAYFKYALDFDIQESGILSALPYLTMWLLAFPVSWFSDFALQKGASVTLVRKVCTTVGMWGPAACLLALNLVQSGSQSTYVFIFVMAVGLNSAITCGAELNHIDLTPNYSGSLVSFTNTLVKFCGLLAPIAVGYIVSDMTNVIQWRVVFYTTAAIYFLMNLIFLIFGTAEKQFCNDEEDELPYIIKSPRLSTISIPYPGEFNNIDDNTILQNKHAK